MPIPFFYHTNISIEPSHAQSLPHGDIYQQKRTNFLRLYQGLAAILPPPKYPLLRRCQTPRGQPAPWRAMIRTPAYRDPWVSTPGRFLMPSWIISVIHFSVGVSLGLPLTLIALATGTALVGKVKWPMLSTAHPGYIIMALYIGIVGSYSVGTLTDWDDS